MKTATVTWITYRNYGTVLQAFALQQAVASLGHQNEILSDEEVLKVFRAAHPYPKTKAPGPRPAPRQTMGVRLLGLLRHPRRIIRSLQLRFDPEAFSRPYLSSQKAIAEFAAQTLIVRKDVSLDKLRLLNEDYDAFLCGSDQIWMLRPADFNPYYFLDFVRKPKLSYAPSLGTDRVPPERGAELRTLLSDFQGLSVREKCSAEQLSALLGREVRWVCDPTLLHNPDFWRSFAEPVKPLRRPCLLCYFLESRDWYFDYAEALAKKLRLRLLLLPSRRDHLSRPWTDTSAVGPREFVARFRDAAYVLTDSYHGSIFALQFEKDFQYLLRFRSDDPESQNARVFSLFDRLGLRNRIVAEDSEERPADQVSDYEGIRRELSRFREDSIQYLQSNLERVMPALSD